MVTHEKSQYVLAVYIMNELIDSFEVDEPNVGANYWSPNINCIRALRDTSLFVPWKPTKYYRTTRTWYGRKKYYEFIKDKWVEVPNPNKD